MKMEAVNAAKSKQHNNTAILRLLSKRSLSRADLGRELKLTRASAGDHIDRLLADGKVRELGIGRIGRGRKPILLDINPDYGCFAGIYLSRELCRYGLVDMKGGLISEKILDGAPQMEPDAVLKTAAREIVLDMKEHGIPMQKMIGVGVSAPGPVDTKKGVILTSPGFSRWHGAAIAEKLGGMLGKPVFLENNAASQTLAELRFGYGRRYDSFLMLVVDSGIGGGMVLNGQRLSGANGFGAEFGHASVMVDGRLCNCGNRGCLERYAAIPELLRDCFAPQDGMSSWRQIADGAENNDIKCINAVEREALYLAAGIVSFVNILEPRAIILSGDLCYKPDRLIGIISDILASRAMMRGILKIDVFPSALGAYHHILSAVAPAIDAYYEYGAI